MSKVSSDLSQDKDKAMIQCDVVGWKVIAPDGTGHSRLEIDQAVAALMAYNSPNATTWAKNWWPNK